MRKLTTLISVLIVLSVLMAACAPAAAPAEKKTVAVVLDTGGENDKSFNEYTLKGARDAATKLGYDVSYVVSASSSDYEKNI